MKRGTETSRRSTFLQRPEGSMLPKPAPEFACVTEATPSPACKKSKGGEQDRDQLTLHALLRDPDGMPYLSESQHSLLLQEDQGRQEGQGPADAARLSAAPRRLDAARACPRMHLCRCDELMH